MLLFKVFLDTVVIKFLFTFKEKWAYNYVGWVFRKEVRNVLSVLLEDDISVSTDVVFICRQRFGWDRKKTLSVLNLCKMLKFIETEPLSLSK